jgi:hypothetical protein
LFRPKVTRKFFMRISQDFSDAWGNNM